MAGYLAAAVGLQGAFYVSLGVLASFVVNRAPTLRSRTLQLGTVPVIVVSLAMAIRSLKVGHLPLWINAVIPLVACLLGVGLGLGVLYRHWKMYSVGVLLVLGGALWWLLAGTSVDLRNATKAHLQRLVAAAPGLPSGEARFGALLQTVFAPEPNMSTSESAVQRNRAAILALGIAIGHHGLARLVGLDPEDDLVLNAGALCQGTTLRGREDWPRHYALSAALAVLEHPLVADAGGLMKEQLDALTHGSGFSFGDLAVDRAGVRFATAATSSELAAMAMQARLKKGYEVNDFFPLAIEVRENLTVEQFRRDFGGVGTARYRFETHKIETDLDRCAALSFPTKNQ
jgi:hypothetical protein